MSLNRRNLVFFLIAILFLVAGFFWFRKPPLEQNHETHHDGPKELSLAIAPIVEKGLAPQTVSHSPSEKLKASADCQGEWDYLMKLDLTRALTTPLNGGMLAFDVSSLKPLSSSITQAALKKGCSNLPKSHPMKAFHQKFATACVNFDTNCLMQLLAYRSHLIDVETKAPLDKIENVEVLINKFYASLFGGVVPDSARMAQIADRILELQPNNQSAFGLALRAKYMDYCYDSENAEKEKALADLLDRTDSQFPKSEVAMEIRLNQFRQQKDWSQLRKSAESYSTHFPESEVPLYYLAWAEYESGNVAEAESRLSQLIAQHPHSLYGPAVLEKIRGQRTEGTSNDSPSTSTFTSVEMNRSVSSSSPFSEMDTSIAVGFKD